MKLSLFIGSNRHKTFLFSIYQTSGKCYFFARPDRRSHFVFNSRHCPAFSRQFVTNHVTNRNWLFPGLEYNYFN